MQAVEFGQSGLVGNIMSLDVNSETFTTDLARLQGQVRKPVVASTVATQVVDIGGIQTLINSKTGEVIKSLGAKSNEAGTVSGKPQTATQALVQGFADRLTDANRTFTSIGDKFAGQFSFGNLLPNQLQTSERQQFEQAKRNFVNAVLRRESGAVISPSEFANADLQYFAQPGDTKGVLLQKAQNRNTVTNGMYNQANIARPVNAGDIIESNGVKYQVDEDGVTINPI